MVGGKKALEALRAHPLLNGAVPDRQSVHYREHPPVPGESAGAIAAVPSWRQADELVKELGRSGYEPAVPTIIELWQRCPVLPVRISAGHALLALGTPAAHGAVQAALEEADHVPTFLALKSILLSDAPSAFDRLERYISDEAIIDEPSQALAGQILWFFGPSTYTHEGPAWNPVTIPAVLRSDRRWVDAAIRLRRHPKVGAHARHLLKTLERNEVEAALQRHPAPPRPVPLPFDGPRDFAARYDRGEHVIVWRELRALGAFPDDDLRREAEAVARATMERVRANVEIVTTRLREQGYPFDRSLPPSSAPSPSVLDDIGRIEAAAGGRVPVSLRLFWSVVGEVQWKHDDDRESPPWAREMSLAKSDPLYVLSAAHALHSVKSWQERLQEHHPEVVGPLELDLAPDYLHKANISGGAPYAIGVPWDVADAVLLNEEHQLPFVEYLRLCFEWGGFPRLELADPTLRTRTFLDEIRRGLVPF